MKCMSSVQMIAASLKTTMSGLMGVGAVFRKSYDRDIARPVTVA